jgi:signal peptidase I
MGKLLKIPKVIKTFGDSMYPLLLDKDILYLKKITFSSIKVNDIITIREKGYYFTHRVIYKGQNYLLTKGDNNPIMDKKVYPKNIVGIVENVKRQGNMFNPEQLYLFQSTTYFGEIVKIKNILEKNQIEMVFLKGLPLHLYFEKAHPKRLYADCDILIKPKDFPKVKKLLSKFGYRKIEDSLSQEHKKLKNKESEISFMKTLNGFHVVFDVHFEIVFLMTQLGELNFLYPQNKINLLTEEFMSDKRIIKVLGEDFPILSQTNLIIYLCLHLFHHNFTGVYRYDFIDKIIRTDRPDYKRITETVKKYSLQNFIYPCFILLSKYYQTPLDKKIVSSIKPGKSVLSFIKKNIVNMDIFGQGKRIESGVKRFKMIFFLSPYPIYKKVLVFFNKEVLYSVFWVFYKRLKLFKPF